MLTVHHLNNSRSQRVLWLLEEFGTPYEIVRYQRQPDIRAPAELRAMTDGKGADVVFDPLLVRVAEGRPVTMFKLQAVQRQRDADARRTKGESIGRSGS